MDEHFDPNDYADLSQLLADFPAPAVESGTAVETPAAPLVVAAAAPVAPPSDARTLTALLADIERRLLAIEALARRNGWPIE